MKTSPKIVLALLAAVSCAAGADTYSSQADQARRDRNREEALASYRAGNMSAGNTTARAETNDVAQSARQGAHKVAEGTRNVARKTANEANRLGHKVAVQARETTARTEAKFAPVDKKDSKGEAANAANGPKP